jgi:hypothetical protein
MHGIQHLFRQHALDKQSSADCWHSSSFSNGRKNDSNSDLKTWSQGMWYECKFHFYNLKYIRYSRSSFGSVS